MLIPAPVITSEYLETLGVDPGDSRYLGAITRVIPGQADILQCQVKGAMGRYLGLSPVQLADLTGALMTASIHVLTRIGHYARSMRTAQAGHSTPVITPMDLHNEVYEPNQDIAAALRAWQSDPVNPPDPADCRPTPLEALRHQGTPLAVFSNLVAVRLLIDEAARILHLAGGRVPADMVEQFFHLASAHTYQSLAPAAS